MPDAGAAPEPAYERVKEALLHALDLPAGEVAGWLDVLASEDEPLARRVRHLLDAHRSAGTFLDVPDEGFHGPSPLPAPRIGGRIGAFTIERELGHGGMGTVLLGSRSDGGFVQRVAIKVLRGAGIGRSAVARLKDERRILASLSHPLIAHFVDGGATDDGQPYLAMEYVDGVPITTYCDERGLSTSDRVRLFMQVCDAVRFAHTRLVVHRDIKPSNILVTADGTPKLLDFGIAKLLDPLQVPDAVTVHVLTPFYASPEQAAGTVVTTATDVYSLGVLLYELLTGAGPYRSVSAESPLLAVLQAIRHEDPEVPSIAARRAGRDLDEDLDAILLKALRKAEADRYGSVGELVEDLERQLGGHPVLAHDGSRAYRLRRFAARNRAAVAAGTVAILSLLAAAVISTWQAQVARHERALADARFSEVRSLANAVVGPLYDAINRVPGSTEAKQLLVKEAVAYLDRLAAQETGDLALQVELANAYQKIGDVQGNMFDANLGDVTGAKASYARLLQLRQAVFDAQSGDASARRGLANAHARQADTALGESRFDDAVAGYRRGLAVLDGAASPDTSEATLLTRAAMLQHQAVALNWAGKWEEAVALFQQAIALVEPIATRPGASDETRRSLLSAKGNLGDVFYYRERWPESILHFKAAMTLARELEQTSKDRGTARRNVYLTTGRVAAALVEAGAFDEAARYRAEAIAIQTAAVALDPRDVMARFNLSNDYQSLGVLLYRSGDMPAALQELNTALETADAAFAISPDQRSQLYAYSGIWAWRSKAALALGDYQRAIADMRKAIAIIAAPDIANRKPADMYEYYEWLGDSLEAAARASTSVDVRRQAREAWITSRDGYAKLAASGDLPRSYAERIPVLDRKIER